MEKLKKLLNDSKKARRNRRKTLNIQITILGWSVEFIGFLMVFLGTVIIGHEDSTTTLCLQTLTLIVYFIALPSTFLLNGNDVKDQIVDSNFYISFIGSFKGNKVGTINEENNAENNVPGRGKENITANHLQRRKH